MTVQEHYWDTVDKPQGTGLKSSFFTPSQYDADLTMDGTAQTGAIATGATKIQFVNLGATTEAIRVAFGTSALDAGNNLTIAAAAATTGYYIPAEAEGGSGEPADGIHFGQGAAGS